MTATIQTKLPFIDDWARTDQDTLHYSCMHVLDLSSDMLSITDSWDWDSTGWAHLDLRQSLDSYVHALAEYKGDLIAAGAFIYEHGGTTIPLNRIARWDGSAWRPLGSGMNHWVDALTVYQGDLIAGGHFTEAGGISASYIARWDGQNWHALTTSMNGSVRVLTVYNGDLIAGGDFTTPISGITSAGVARWDGSEWHSMTNSTNNRVYALTVYHDTLIVGGEFTSINGIARYRLACWDGSDWFNPTNMEANAPVRALTVYNGDLIVGGEFNEAGGIAAYGIVRWNGSEWDMPGAGFNNAVYSLTTFNMDLHGEVLVAGGDFVDLEIPDAFIRLAWYDDDHWSPFEVDSSGANNFVLDMIEYDGDLILGGSFSHLHSPWQVTDMPSYFIGRVKPEGDGVFATLQARSDFIVDIVSEDVDFASDSADELIVRGYQDPSPSAGPRTAFWVLGVDAEFDGCYRVGNYAADGIWGIDGINGSRRTMAVGDFVDDDNDYMDLLLLVTDTIDANSTIIQAWEIDTTILIPCGDPSQTNLPFIAGWSDTSETITELIMANLDTATIELGAPTFYSVDSIIQPLVILNVPPVHYDILDDTVWDVSNRYPWPPDAGYETYCAYGNRESWVTSVHSEIRRDWGISVGLKTHFSAAGATVKAHLNTTYGEGFSQQGTNTTTLSVIQEMTSHSEDMILAASIDYDIWEYPVYRRGVRLIGGDVVVVDPSEVRKVWIVAKENESWISHHEVENIFSYARYQDFADNPMVASEGVIQGYTWPMTPSTQGYFALRKEEFESSTVEQSSNFGIEVGASLGYEGGLNFFGFKMKFGVEVSVESNYSQSELNTYTTTFTTADSIHVQYGYINSSGSFEGNRKYEITPYAYWAKNGALVLDYAAGPVTNNPGEDPTWWQIHYSDPDPAFILPWRLDPEKDGSDPSENRYKTREIVFIPKYPDPGDTVLIIARVHNFSLNPTLDPVKVSFYLGDPDFGGTILTDKNSGDSIFWACDADGIPTVIWSQGEVAAQMVWQVPDAGSITGCQRIWALIDPLDEISPEVHDNDAEITNNKGWNRLDVNTPDICIDRDGDGWEEATFRCHTCANEWDNCPDVYNPDQTDTDGDGVGDACQYGPYICGDANGDGGCNLGDAGYIINYIFYDGPNPVPIEAGDANADGGCNLGDAGYIINYIFYDGPDPVCP